MDVIPFILIKIILLSLLLHYVSKNLYFLSVEVLEKIYNKANSCSCLNILVRKDMDVNEHERLSNFTLRHEIE
jgi:hypothetical protein